MLVGQVLFDEPELNRSAAVAVGFAHPPFQVAAVAPVDVAAVASEDLEGRRGIIGLLHHVVEFGRAVLEAGWRMGIDGLAQPLVQFASGNAFVAFDVNLEGQIE